MRSQRRSRNSIVLTLLLLASVATLAAAADVQRVVNVNTADAKQLALLPRVGLSVAQRIVDYRKQNGPFKTTDELMLVRGIGEKLFAQLKPYVVTSGETTLDEKAASGGKGKGSKGKGSKAKGAKAKGAAKTATKGSSKSEAPSEGKAATRASRTKTAVAAPAPSAKPAGGRTR